jgi:hypothetical protein
VSIDKDERELREFFVQLAFVHFDEKVYELHNSHTKRLGDGRRQAAQKNKRRAQTPHL